MTANTKAQEALHQALAERLRASTACTAIGYIKHGEESGRKLAIDEVDYLVRIKKQANEGNFGLDDTLLHALRRIIGDVVTEALKHLLDPDPDDERDRCAFFSPYAADLSGEALAWFGLGFIHGAAEVFGEAEGKLRL